MTINNDDTRNISQLNLDRASGSAPISSGVPSNTSSANQTSANDSIALSTSNDLVQQALSSGTADRAARIQQLQQLVQSNQYQVDAAGLSKALIAAHLTGN